MMNTAHLQEGKIINRIKIEQFSAFTMTNKVFRKMKRIYSKRIFYLIIRISCEFASKHFRDVSKDLKYFK